MTIDPAPPNRLPPMSPRPLAPGLAIFTAPSEWAIQRPRPRACGAWGAGAGAGGAVGVQGTCHPHGRLAHAARAGARHHLAAPACGGKPRELSGPFAAGAQRPLHVGGFLWRAADRNGGAARLTRQRFRAPRHCPVGQIAALHAVDLRDLRKLVFPVRWRPVGALRAANQRGCRVHRPGERCEVVRMAAAFDRAAGLWAGAGAAHRARACGGWRC